MRFGFTFYVLCRSRELLIHGGREGLSGTRTPSETAAPTSAQSYVGPSHQGVCIWVCICVCVEGRGLHDMPTHLVACLLLEGNEGRPSNEGRPRIFCPSSLLTPFLAYFFFSLLDRRGFVNESAVTIEEEAETGYGATSSVPKVSTQTTHT